MAGTAFTASPAAGFALRLPLSRWWALLPLAIFAALLCGCILYLALPHDALAAWYLALHPCIYKHDVWTATFFTPTAKMSGNRYAAVAILLCLVFIAGCIAHLRRKAESPAIIIRAGRPDALALGTLYCFFAVVWTYGFVTAFPSYDEVFSAINCASIHPLQAGSYYMIPNNHILFNLLNSGPAHWLRDPVASGRVVSGLAMLPLVAMLYFRMRAATGRVWVAVVFCMVMLLQLPVWGFSFQARGYAIYLLASWSSFIALEYYLKTGNRATLSLHAAAVVAGFWTMPSFLFWEAALAGYIAIAFVVRRRIDRPLAVAQLCAVGAAFLLYVPVICFSGIGALTENAYVTGAHKSVEEYLPGFWEPFRCGIQYCFSGDVDARNISYLVLFFLPLAMLPFLRRTGAFSVVLFYVLAWGAFFIAELRMQRYPFMRNMIAHDSITLAALLAGGYCLAMRLRRRQWQTPALAGGFTALLLLSIHFIRFNRGHIHSGLYSYDVDIRYRSLQAAVLRLPPGARVGLSDEGFYWEYLCRMQGIPASMCAGDAATHYIKMDKEPLPAALSGRAVLVDKADEYEIYRVGR